MPSPTTGSPSSPNGVSPTRELTHKAAGPPIDYSFKELKNVTDVLYEDPISGVTTRPKISREQAASDYLDSIVCPEGEQTPGSTPLTTPPRTRGDVKFNSNSVRLCNNSIMTLKGLDRVMHHLLDCPVELTWLDVSCNQLASIEDVILKFPKLQVLYLHGNHIASMHDVLALAKLEHLQKLTLHGNPISERPNYKLWVCAHLPKLRSLDFSTITKLERDRVATWYRGYMKQQEGR